MQKDLENFFYRSEDHYLEAPEIHAFKHQVDLLAQRLETYKCLRDREIAVFQAVADELLATFADENPQRLESAIKHWLSVMRYCAMAVLLNNPEFFQHRLLEWLTDIIHAHQMQVIEQKLADSLKANLKRHLTPEQWGLVEPFFSQAQKTLLAEKSSPEAITL